jgi:hypothetical protein
MDLQVTAEVLTVDGKNHPVGKVFIRLEAEKLSLVRNGRLLCQFKYKKIDFTSEYRKGPDCMLLQSDGLKFIFKSNAVTNKSIVEALTQQKSSLKSAGMKPGLSHKEIDLDGNIQNINPNKGVAKSNSNPRGRTGTSLIDLPKPPSRTANMRNPSAASTAMISSDHSVRMSQSEASRGHHQHLPHSKLQISGTKSVSVGRASLSSSVIKEHDDWGRASQDSTESPSRVKHLHHLTSPLPSLPPTATSVHSPAASIKKLSRESPLQRVYNTLKLFSSDERRSNAKAVADACRLRDQPKMNALPPSHTESSKESPFANLFKPSMEDQERQSVPKIAAAAAATSSSDKVRLGQGMGKLNFFTTDRSYKNPEKRAENREVSDEITLPNSNNSSSSSSITYRNRQGLFPRAPIITLSKDLSKDLNKDLSKDDEDAKDMARAIADSVITADAEKEKSFQNFSYDLESFNSVEGGENENNMKIEKRGRYEGMRNLGNTCYLASISQVSHPPHRPTTPFHPTTATLSSAFLHLLRDSTHIVPHVYSPSSPSLSLSLSFLPISIRPPLTLISTVFYTTSHHILLSSHSYPNQQ